MLLLPGALGTGLSDWRPQLEGLNSSGKLTLVAWDPPGYGKSRPPERSFAGNFFLQDAKVAKEFMESLGHEKFSIGNVQLFVNLMFILYVRWRFKIVCLQTKLASHKYSFHRFSTNVARFARRSLIFMDFVLQFLLAKNLTSIDFQL